MEEFAQYGHALVAMVGVALLQMLLSPISAMRKTAAGLAPGAQPEADYSDKTYRMHRAYANLAKSIGPFVAVALAAMLAGAPAFWVNLLASLFFAFRVIMLVVHVQGLGKPDMSLRSFSYVAGWLMCLGLGFLTIKAVFFGG